jgi:hypothetical protein
MLAQIEAMTGAFVGIVWGLPLVLTLCFSGIFFTIYFGFPQLRFFKHAIEVVSGKYSDLANKGEISSFQALCSALSATVGHGNIAGQDLSSVWEQHSFSLVGLSASVKSQKNLSLRWWASIFSVPSGL